MLLDEISGYSFISRSGGVVVLKGHIYIGFFENFNEALDKVIGG